MCKNTNKLRAEKNAINLKTQKENVNEELKVQNQLEWVDRMNNILNRVEEIIINEIINV